MNDNGQTVQTDAGLATQQQTSPADNSQAGEQAENVQAQTPQFVTPEQLEQFGKSIVSRLQQSNRDRTNTINREIAGIKELLGKTGVTIQPEHEAKLREEIGERLDNPNATQTTQPIEESAFPDPDVMVSEFVNDIFSTVGTPVTPSDPEWAALQKTIDDTWNDPKGHIKVTAAATLAAQNKARRLASNQENASARVTGMGGAQPIGSPDAPASDFWKQAYKK